MESTQPMIVAANSCVRDTWTNRSRAIYSVLREFDHEFQERWNHKIRFPSDPHWTQKPLAKYFVTSMKRP